MSEKEELVKQLGFIVTHNTDVIVRQICRRAAAYLSSNAEYVRGLEEAAKEAERTRTAPSRLIGATWQEPIYKDGVFIAANIRALKAPK